MTSDKTTTRRHYSAEFQAQVGCECDALGASVAKVAMAVGDICLGRRATLNVPDRPEGPIGTEVPQVHRAT